MNPLRGALVEYGGKLLGPIPNVVVFQFNPEQLVRTIHIPGARATGASDDQRRTVETGQSAAPPLESFSVTARFSVADELGEGGAASAIPRAFGVGPQLAALEKMVYPPAQPGGALGEAVSAAIDAIGNAVSSDGNKKATRPVPRVTLPRLLFIWGLTRVLPVRIQSMRITEQKFDFLLNPVQAEVEIGLEVASEPPPGDVVAKGALLYSLAIKDANAMLNLTKSIELVAELIPF